MARSSSPYLFLIHLMPWSWASTMRGHRWVLQRMVAFSVDVRSLGSPWLLQAATSAASVRRLRGSSPGVMGMGTCQGGAIGRLATEERDPCGAGRHGGKKSQAPRDRTCGHSPPAC